MRKIIKKVAKKVPGVGSLAEELNTLRTEKGILQLEKGNLEAVIREKDAVINSKRNFLAERYIHGSGIEIGAAQMPVKTPAGVKVRYVDVFTAEELKKALPKIYTKLDIIKVDVVDDGEKLDKFKDGSLDFIIANHFIEHCLDPIGTILNMYKKLRKEGVLYFGIPDKRYTFDKPRPITNYQHLLDEHNDKSKNKFRLEHTIEYAKVKLGKKATKQAVDKRVQELLDSDYRIHYHVWTQHEMTEMFIRIAQDYKLDLEIEALLKNYHEVIYVLRKKPAHKPIDFTPQM
jgi:predicted SAM-dependent methyltransferase